MQFSATVTLALALLTGTALRARSRRRLMAASSPGVFVTWVSSVKGSSKAVTYESSEIQIEDGSAIVAFLGDDTSQLSLTDHPRDLLNPIKKTLPRFAKLSAAFVTVTPASV